MGTITLAALRRLRSSPSRPQCHHWDRIGELRLAPGARLGSYEIIAALGAGGMGEVYLAHDTRLSRDIALKILPRTFADNAERLTRFRREARVLASLNHPNIAAIHGLEKSSDVDHLILELVEGEISLGRYPSTRRSTMPVRSPKRWKPLTGRASSTAI